MSQKDKNYIKTIGTYRKDTIQNLNLYANGPASIMRTIYNFILNSMSYAYLAVRKLRDKADYVFNRAKLVYLPVRSSTIDWPNVNSNERNENSRGIAIIADLNSTRGKFFRIDSRKETLEKLKANVFITLWKNTSDAINTLQFCNSVILYNVPYDDSSKEIYAEANRLGIKKYYDLDGSITSNLYRQAMEAADVLLVGTKSIQKAFHESYPEKEVYIWPDGVPERLNCVASVSKEKVIDDGNGIIKLYVFIEEKSKNEDHFRLLELPLARILEEFHGVHCEVYGNADIPEKLTKFQQRIHFLGTMLPENAWDEMTNCDISLIPTGRSLYDSSTACASYLESSVLGIPSVLSSESEFSSILSDGENAFLATDEEEWYQKIRKLIVNRELRLKMAENAKKTVYSFSGQDKQTEIAKEVLLNQNSSVENKRKTILYTNCYYGLTSFGGATVVAEGIAESIAMRFPEKYNVCVFTVHPDNDVAPGTIRSYLWNNVTVYSCSANINADEEIENEVVTRSFEYLLHQIKPNLVHHHAVQGFGYGIAQVCRKLAVPYVVTMHDAWVCCPRLFMNNLKNKHCGEHGLSAAECMERCNFQPDYTVERRRKLKEYLQCAQRVYVPSDYFKETQSRFLPDISFFMNKNGITFNRTEQKQPRKLPLKFLFVAGGQTVKGFDLIINSLKEFASLEWELILVTPGGMKKTDYGEIRDHITFLGRQTQKEMEMLYKKAHVLLFPSLTYESFGLTVREAIANDCFVVSSRCGGPSEAIVDGENGRLFDIGDETAFKEILQEILTNQEKYLNYKTSNWGDVRSFDDQADELLEDYVIVMNEGEK